MAKIEIDGQSLEVEPGTMVIQAADAAGIYIPRFCYHDKLSVAANCRMCMVEVEKAPKPLPACATPVVDGMKIFTASTVATEAQKGTMEFLLINHPLDCPVCDQGGECPLQDQALGYGKDVSRFSERKRVVKDKDIGPLIATEMTRCIHCTRCVRFGQEIAGIMELGAVGRGEHMEIGTFLGNSVGSELSGNVIDLCPVGALTNKPYRFTARAWELTDHDGISPHDCVGTNTNIQSIRSVVKRVLPRVNEAVNECWLADRDRFSYEALNRPDRLTRPMVRENGVWQQTNWETALNFAATGIRQVINKYGAEQFGALASPLSTLEEFYLLQKLVRGLGSPNVDHRVQQLDFNDDHMGYAGPGLSIDIADIENTQSVLLIGSNLRKDQPLLGLRARKAALNGAQVMAINHIDHEFHFDLAHKIVTTPSKLPVSLGGVVKAAYKGATAPKGLSSWSRKTPDDVETAIAKAVMDAGENGLIVLGNAASRHRDASALRAMAQALADATGARLGFLGEANSAAGWLGGCVPHIGPGARPLPEPGSNALQMLRQPLKGYLLLGLEPHLDCIDGHAAQVALESADFVVAMHAFDVSAHIEADVLLPVAPFSETSGTYVNCTARSQSVRAAVTPAGDARPAWKVLRVLGNLFSLEGFEQVSSTDVTTEIEAAPAVFNGLGKWQITGSETLQLDEVDLERINDIPLYRVDGIVRRAAALQATDDNPAVGARLNQHSAERLSLYAGDVVNAHSDNTSVQLPIVIDHRVPPDCVYIPAGYDETSALGASATVRLVRA